MPVMLRFILAACFFAFTAAHAQQIILLKLDDVIAREMPHVDVVVVANAPQATFVVVTTSPAAGVVSCTTSRSD